MAAFCSASAAMIVPQYWAEARLQRPRRKGQGQITVRRFGWSDASQADAEAMAQQRAQEALDRIASGARLPRLELKCAYNGAEGLPIREEVLSRHGDTVITRNGYGAHCLNTPDVLFADVDFSEPNVGPAGCLIMLVLVALSIYGGAQFRSLWLGIGLLLVSAFLIVPLVNTLKRFLRWRRGDPEVLARAKAAAFVQAHPAWRIRIYRTPAGLRLLALHALFDPAGPEATELFSALGIDRVYAAMCRNQHCFRARVSPKPWRIGIGTHMRPRPGVWPVRAEQLEPRNTWVREYEAAARSHASCRYVESLGTGSVHPKADAVRTLHDQLAQALSGLPIA